MFAWQSFGTSSGLSGLFSSVSVSSESGNLFVIRSKTEIKRPALALALALASPRQANLPFQARPKVFRSDYYADQIIC